MAIEYKEGRGINFTDLLKENMETGKIPEPLSGQEVAKLVERLFGKVSVDMGCHLVDSNVVLTFAGLKGRTEFTIDVPTDEDVRRTESETATLNTLLREADPNILLGLSKKILDRTASGEKRPKYKFMWVENLVGYERASKTSKLPGVTPFERNRGWSGLRQWYNKTWDNLVQAQKEGKIPPGDIIEDIMAGLELGYPDTAIMDIVDWVNKGSKDTMQDAAIPHTGTYHEQEPNYDFYPEHANDESIRRNIEQAGNVLQEFYYSDWHKHVAPSLKFHREK